MIARNHLPVTDGKGRFLDNIFVERLWPLSWFVNKPLLCNGSMKYECVYLHAWETGSEAKAGVGKWIDFYNRKRPHSAPLGRFVLQIACQATLGGKPPTVVYWLRKEENQIDQQEQRVA